MSAIGLDEKEIRFHIAALQVGSAPVAEVASHAKVARTYGYDIFARLEKRGVITQSSFNGVRHVVAEYPIVPFQNWNRTHDMLNELVPELRSLFNAAPSKPAIRYYEGDEGIAKVLWGVLDCKSKKLSGILCMHELLDVPGFEGMQKFIDELRVLRSPSHETANIWATSNAGLRTPRLAPEPMDLAMTMFNGHSRSPHQCGLRKTTVET